MFEEGTGLIGRFFVQTEDISKKDCREGNLKVNAGKVKVKKKFCKCPIPETSKQKKKVCCPADSR